MATRQNMRQCAPAACNTHTQDALQTRRAPGPVTRDYARRSTAASKGRQRRAIPQLSAVPQLRATPSAFTTVMRPILEYTRLTHPVPAIRACLRKSAKASSGSLNIHVLVCLRALVCGHTYARTHRSGREQDAAPEHNGARAQTGATLHCPEGTQASVCCVRAMRMVHAGCCGMCVCTRGGRAFARRVDRPRSTCTCSCAPAANADGNADARMAHIIAAHHQDRLLLERFKMQRQDAGSSHSACEPGPAAAYLRSLQAEAEKGECDAAGVLDELLHPREPLPPAHLHVATNHTSQHQQLQQEEMKAAERMAGLVEEVLAVEDVDGADASPRAMGASASPCGVQAGVVPPSEQACEEVENEEGCAAGTVDETDAAQDAASEMEAQDVEEESSASAACSHTAGAHAQQGQERSRRERRMTHFYDPETGNDAAPAAPVAVAPAPAAAVHDTGAARGLHEDDEDKGEEGGEEEGGREEEGRRRQASWVGRQVYKHFPAHGWFEVGVPRCAPLCPAVPFSVPGCSPGRLRRLACGQMADASAEQQMTTFVCRVHVCMRACVHACMCACAGRNHQASQRRPF